MSLSQEILLNQDLSLDEEPLIGNFIRIGSVPLRSVSLVIVTGKMTFLFGSMTTAYMPLESTTPTRTASGRSILSMVLRRVPMHRVLQSLDRLKIITPRI
jgi:hypothetical protein